MKMSDLDNKIQELVVESLIYGASNDNEVWIYVADRISDKEQGEMAKSWVISLLQKLANGNK